MTDELGNMAGSVHHDVVVRGRTVRVSEVTMKTMTPFAAACAPFLSEFDEAGRLGGRKDAEGNVIPNDQFELFKVLAENGPAFVSVAALVTDAPKDFIESLRPDEFFDVAAKIVEVNGNFFVLRLAPALLRFAQGVAQIGLIQSKP